MESHDKGEDKDVMRKMATSECIHTPLHIYTGTNPSSDIATSEKTCCVDFHLLQAEDNRPL